MLSHAAALTGSDGTGVRDYGSGLGARHDSFVSWLAPVFATSIYSPHEGDTLQWVLGTTDAVLAVIGLSVAWFLWRRRTDRPALEPLFLQRVWYWDAFYDAVIGRPGQALARFSAVVIDGRVIDGAVNGVASLVRVTGNGVRKVQTGYVRNYALGIALGLAAIIAFMISRVWWS